jgi:hypothetical protein
VEQITRGDRQTGPQRRLTRDLLRRGQLPARKIGRRTIVLERDLLPRAPSTQATGFNPQPRAVPVAHLEPREAGRRDADRPARPARAAWAVQRLLAARW